MNDRVEYVVGEHLKAAGVTVVPKEESELSLTVYLALYNVDGKTRSFGYLYHSNRRIARLDMQMRLIDMPTGRLLVERDGTARSIWHEGSILFVPTHYTETVSAQSSVAETVSVVACRRYSAFLVPRWKEDLIRFYY